MDSSPSSLHIAMYPWLAFGHLTPFLHLANKLAKRGHRITFFAPSKAEAKLESLNLHPHLITFITINVPYVEGLPPNSQTTADVPKHLIPHIMTAMDLTQNDIETHLSNLKPHFVFYDFTHWIPSLTRRLGIKSVCYLIVSSVMVGYTYSPPEAYPTEFDFTGPPLEFPDSSSIKLHAHEARAFASFRKTIFGSNVQFYDRLSVGFNEADALGFKTCREIEGPYLDYIEKQYNKPVLASGPVILEPPTSVLDEKWATWLGGFKSGSVVYCCFGSECILSPNLFQELVLGLELTGFPFLAALKPPFGFEYSVEEALPEGFLKRVEGRGIVHGGWVQQQLILEHPSVGCFITHCGSGSLSEALVNNCQIVLLPNVADQIVNARMMGNNLKVGVEVEKGEEDGMYTKDNVCKAVNIVMDDENETSKKVRANHAKIRELLLNKDLESSYLDNFCNKLQEIVHN